MNSPHRAVIFDLFGTLVQTVSPDDYEGMLTEIASTLRANPYDFTTQWRATITARESGELGDIDNVLSYTANAVGASPSQTDIAIARRRWQSIAVKWLAPRSDAVTTLQYIGSCGMQVGLLSNCSCEIPPIWPSNPLSTLFDAAVFSCEVGMMKPNERIYQLICGSLRVNPEDCLFVGDGGSRELSGAETAGLESVLLRVPGEEHTWFDANYRLDALEWKGHTIETLLDVCRFIRVSPGR